MTVGAREDPAVGGRTPSASEALQAVLAGLAGGRTRLQARASHSRPVQRRAQKATRGAGPGPRRRSGTTTLNTKDATSPSKGECPA